MSKDLFFGKNHVVGIVGMAHTHFAFAIAAYLANVKVKKVAYISLQADDVKLSDNSNAALWSMAKDAQIMRESLYFSYMNIDVYPVLSSDKARAICRQNYDFVIMDIARGAKEADRDSLLMCDKVLLFCSLAPYDVFYTNEDIRTLREKDILEMGQYVLNLTKEQYDMYKNTWGPLYAAPRIVDPFHLKQGEKDELSKVYKYVLGENYSTERRRGAGIACFWFYKVVRACKKRFRRGPRN